jgi:hypothetical protein
MMSVNKNTSNNIKSKINSISNNKNNANKNFKECAISNNNMIIKKSPKLIKELIDDDRSNSDITMPKPLELNSYKKRTLNEALTTKNLLSTKALASDSPETLDSSPFISSTAQVEINNTSIDENKDNNKIIQNSPKFENILNESNNNIKIFSSNNMIDFYDREINNCMKISPDNSSAAIDNCLNNVKNRINTPVLAEEEDSTISLTSSSLTLAAHGTLNCELDNNDFINCGSIF